MKKLKRTEMKKLKVSEFSGGSVLEAYDFDNSDITGTHCLMMVMREPYGDGSQELETCILLTRAKTKKLIKWLQDFKKMMVW